MNVDIGGKVVLVTGAAHGIGATLIRGLHAEGARVVGIDIANTITGLGDELGDRAFGALADVSDEGDLAAVRDQVAARFGYLDAVVNNAAITPSARIVDTDWALFKRTMEINVGGQFLATKTFLPLLQAGSTGRIVFMSSARGFVGAPGLGAYSASKAAILNLANVVHQELKDDGIRTVALVPGLTDTADMRQAVAEEWIERVSATYPGGRLGQPEDLVDWIVFLVSDRAQHLAGTVLSIRP